jgi:hypothetical protein
MPERGKLPLPLRVLLEWQSNEIQKRPGESQILSRRRHATKGNFPVTLLQVLPIIARFSEDSENTIPTPEDNEVAFKMLSNV